MGVRDLDRFLSGVIRLLNKDYKQTTVFYSVLSGF